MLSLLIFSKEEDLVLSLYNRSLLNRFAIDDIMTLLKKAHDFIQGNLLELPATLKQALSTRIELRLHLLAAFDSEQVDNKERTRDWIACTELLSTLKETSKLGKPVEDSFSIKLQRKLASTVPPRPIVDVDFDSAWDLLSRICICGRDAYRILDNHGGNQLQVCKNRCFLETKDLDLTAHAELRLVISIADTAAAGVHSLSSSVSYLHRHESA